MSDRPTLSRLLLAIVVAATLTACVSGETGTATGRPLPATSPPAGVADSPPPRPSSPDPSASRSTSASPAPSAAAVMSQPWATVPLTDVRTGQAFTIADHVAAGRVVFVEPMAIWCTKCREQQRAAREAFADPGADRIVWVGLDVELSESAEGLAKYADQNAFPFAYAVSSVDLSRALAAEFGEGVLSPPNVNVIVVATDGTVEHMTGHHGPDELAAIATEAGA